VIPCEWPAFDFDAPNCLAGIGDDSVGGVVATHLLEHLADPRHLLREVGRVLAPGAPFSILVPHGHSLMFAQDLDHKTQFVLDSWNNLLDDSYYTRGKDGFPFKLGFNALVALKESNVALVTQLIKLSEGEQDD
jgi:SAM-dependent methyltransferase